MLILQKPGLRQHRRSNTPCACHGKWWQVRISEPPELPGTLPDTLHCTFSGFSCKSKLQAFCSSEQQSGEERGTGSYRSPSNPGCPFPLQKSRLTLTNDKDPKRHKCFKTKHLHTLAETSPHQHGKAHRYRVCLQRNIVCSHLLVENTNHRKLTSFWSQQMGWERALT